MKIHDNNRSNYDYDYYSDCFGITDDSSSMNKITPCDRKERNITGQRMTEEMESLTRTSITTEEANVLQEASVKAEYESNAREYTRNRVTKQKQEQKATIEKKTTNSNKATGNKKNAIKGTSDSKKQPNSSGKSNASSSATSNGNRWKAAANLSKSLTPEVLKAKNYTIKKNTNRIDYLADGVDAPEDYATSTITGKVKEAGSKAVDIWSNAVSLAFSFNWIAGLVVLIVPVAVVLICFLLFVFNLAIGILPGWANSSSYKVRQLMTQYEYYWDCLNMEVEEAVESNSKGTSIAIPVALDEDNEWSVEAAKGENFVNWREVLAVYYGGLYDAESLPDTELPTLSDGAVIEELYTIDNPSFFNKVFWTMNCVMPSSSALTYDCKEVENITGGEISQVSFNICYKPNIYHVMARLDYKPMQIAMTEVYLGTQFDDYFNSLIENRYVSSGQYVVEAAAAEIGNYGDKYNAYFGFDSDTQWCCVFVSYILDTTGNGKFITDYARCTQAIRAWEERSDIVIVYHVSTGKQEAVVPQPGWIVLFNTDGDSSNCEHIGFVESYDANTSTVITIEGNTRYTVEYEGNNQVLRMHRSNWSTIYAFVEPKYPTTELTLDSRYDDDYNMKTMYSSEYESICYEAEVLIEHNNSAQNMLGVCHSSLALSGTLEWDLNKPKILSSIRIACENDNINPDDFPDIPLTYEILVNYQQSYYEYYLNFIYPS